MSRLRPLGGRGWGRLARRPGLSLAVIGLWSLAVTAGTTCLLGIPTPAVHDEFSYLLAADTFAHGRMTNPPHPLWVHFESMHVIQQPTYASKYPPGQGLLLALGQVLTGRPVVGVWIGTALACMAVGWMLRAFVRPRWALLGGMLAPLHPTLLEWSQNYWGGSLAVLGGALVVGGALRAQTSRDSLLIGVGLVILANTRPYEGLVLSLVVLIPLLSRLWPSMVADFRAALKRFVLPALTVVIPAALWMGYYHTQVTGNSWRLPYSVHEETYAAVPSFLWQSPRLGIEYRHEEIRDFWLGWVLGIFEDQQTPAGLLRGIAWKLRTLLSGSLALAALAFGAIAFCTLARRPAWRQTVSCQIAIFSLALLPTLGIATHYAAPAMGLFFIVGIEGLRSLRTWPRQGGAVGTSLVRLGVLASFGFAIVWVANHRQTPTDSFHTSMAQRSQYLQQLRAEEGRHLVIVRYQPGHNTHAEWVYNGADIDGDKVIWAREMGPDGHRRLREYFQDRRVWLAEPDAQPPRLVLDPDASPGASDVAARRR